MFRLLRAAAAAAVFLLTGAVPTGSLYVTTLPSGADVWVDGTYVGHTPLVLDALAAGRHAMSITKTGWSAQDVAVSIVAGRTALSSVALDRAVTRAVRLDGGTLAIKGLPASEITVDGVAVKPAPDGTIAEPSGPHVVVARTPSGRMTRSVTVYPDMRTDVLLREDEETRSIVVAPADDYLGPNEMKIDGDRIAIRHGGHDVVAHVGSTAYRLDGREMAYDSAPTLINGKLFLPLELLSALTTTTKAK